jgi:hypothetical protein
LVLLVLSLACSLDIQVKLLVVVLLWHWSTEECEYPMEMKDSNQGSCNGYTTKPSWI